MKNQTRLPGPFRIIRYPLEIGGDWEDEVQFEDTDSLYAPVACCGSRRLYHASECFRFA